MVYVVRILHSPRRMGGARTLFSFNVFLLFTALFVGAFPRTLQAGTNLQLTLKNGATVEFRFWGRSLDDVYYSRPGRYADEKVCTDVRIIRYTYQSYAPRKGGMAMDDRGVAMVQYVRAGQGFVMMFGPNGDRVLLPYDSKDSPSTPLEFSWVTREINGRAIHLIGLQEKDDPSTGRSYASSEGEVIPLAKHYTDYSAQSSITLENRTIQGVPLPRHWFSKKIGSRDFVVGDKIIHIRKDFTYSPFQRKFGFATIEKLTANSPMVAVRWTDGTEQEIRGDDLDYKVQVPVKHPDQLIRARDTSSNPNLYRIKEAFSDGWYLVQNAEGERVLVNSDHAIPVSEENEQLREMVRTTLLPLLEKWEELGLIRDEPGSEGEKLLAFQHELRDFARADSELGKSFAIPRTTDDLPSVWLDRRIRGLFRELPGLPVTFKQILERNLVGPQNFREIASLKHVPSSGETEAIFYEDPARKTRALELLAGANPAAWEKGWLVRHLVQELNAYKPLPEKDETLGAILAKPSPKSLRAKRLAELLKLLERPSPVLDWEELRSLEPFTPESVKIMLSRPADRAAPEVIAREILAQYPELPSSLKKHLSLLVREISPELARKIAAEPSYPADPLFYSQKQYQQHLRATLPLSQALSQFIEKETVSLAIGPRKERLVHLATALSDPLFSETPLEHKGDYKTLAAQLIRDLLAQYPELPPELRAQATSALAALGEAPRAARPDEEQVIESYPLWFKSSDEKKRELARELAQEIRALLDLGGEGARVKQLLELNLDFGWLIQWPSAKLAADCSKALNGKVPPTATYEQFLEGFAKVFIREYPDALKATRLLALKVIAKPDAETERQAHADTSYEEEDPLVPRGEIPFDRVAKGSWFSELRGQIAEKRNPWFRAPTYLGLHLLAEGPEKTVIAMKQTDWEEAKGFRNSLMLYRLPRESLVFFYYPDDYATACARLANQTHTEPATAQQQWRVLLKAPPDLQKLEKLASDLNTRRVKLPIVLGAAPCQAIAGIDTPAP